MKKICFGKNITTVNSRMSNLTDNIKSSLREVYRFPQNLVDVSNCFNGCVNLTKFEAELPNTIKNMSSSFEGCGNFYKNVAIPSDCIDMSRSFKGAGIKGSINIPDKVVDMRESFKDSKLEAVSFGQNISHFNNFQESFVNCKTLAYIYGNLPQNIVNAEGSFKNTGVTEVNFFRENSFVNDGKDMFKGCSNLKSSSVDLNINYANDIFNGCYQLQTVKNIYTEVMDNSFKDCRNLKTIGNIKGNSFSNSWNGCSNLQAMGVISGNLNFNNSFNGCSNYSNVVYLNPNSINDSNQEDYEFLASHPLRIYGRGHGYDIEMKFQNSHNLKGDYISGYCDPDEFDTSSNSDYSFGAYKGNTENLVIPRDMRKNLLDDSTKYIPNFYQSFNGKNFSEVKIYGNSKFSTNCFANQSTSFMNILDNPNFYIDTDGTNSCFGDVNSIGLKNCHVEFHGGDTTPVFANSGVMSFNNSSSLLNIKDYSFSKCFSLNSLGTNSEAFLSNINVFGNSSFQDCNNLSMVINIYNASSVGSNAFKNVENTTKIQFPSVSSTKTLVVGNNAFEGCYGVRNISEIPSYTTIRGGAFANIGKTKNQDGTLSINAIDSLTISGSISGGGLKGLYVKEITGPVDSYSFGFSFPSTLTDLKYTKSYYSYYLNGSYIKNITIINPSDGRDWAVFLSNMSYLTNIYSNSPLYISSTIVNSPNIEHITGAGVKSVGENSYLRTWLTLGLFSSMPKLKTLNIAGNIAEGSYITNCPNLENVSINGALYINSIGLNGVFDNCWNVKNVKINTIYGDSNSTKKHFGQLFQQYRKYCDFGYQSYTCSVSQIYNQMVGRYLPSGHIHYSTYVTCSVSRNWNYILDRYDTMYGYEANMIYGPSNLKLENINVGSWGQAFYINQNMVTSGLTQGMSNLKSVAIRNAIDYWGSAAQTYWFSNTPKLNNINMQASGAYIDIYNWFSPYSNGVANTNSSLVVNVRTSNYGVYVPTASKFKSGVILNANGTVVKGTS